MPLFTHHTFIFINLKGLAMKFNRLEFFLENLEGINITSLIVEVNLFYY